MYMLTRSPPTCCQERSNPSRVKPAFSAERSEASFHGSTYSSSRGIFSSENAHSLRSVNTSAAQPFPRADRTSLSSRSMRARGRCRGARDRCCRPDVHWLDHDERIPLPCPSPILLPLDVRRRCRGIELCRHRSDRRNIRILRRFTKNASVGVLPLPKGVPVTFNSRHQQGTRHEITGNRLTRSRRQQ